jgi:hypothetical protein
MTNRIWIAIALITLVAGYGLHHKVERATAPAQQGALFK